MKAPASTIGSRYTEADRDALRRSEFPILRSWTYLDNATFGPVPRAFVRAANEAAQQMSEKRIEEIGASAAMEQLRTDAAGLLRCSPENLALLKSTSEGIGLVAQGLAWRPGDEVILYDREFPGTLAPWIQLKRDGVSVRIVDDRRRARFDASDVEALITPRTRVVCVSLVNSDHGFRGPIAEIAELTRARDIWLAVDAVQAIGTLDIDVGALGADIVAAHGYKFLLSGFGLALVYCSPRAIADLRVPQLGWKNVSDVRASGTEVRNVAASASSNGARRFESTIAAVPTIAGMRASLALLKGIGMARAEAHILGLLDRLASALPDKGYEVLSSRIAPERSALLAFRHRSIGIERLLDALIEHRIAATIRDGAIRISPHVYTTDDDIDHLIHALPDQR